VPAVIGNNTPYLPENASTWSYYNSFISDFNYGDSGNAIMIRTYDILPRISEGFNNVINDFIINFSSDSGLNNYNFNFQFKFGY